MSENQQTETNNTQCLSVSFGYSLIPGRHELLIAKIEEAESYLISVNDQSKELAGKGPLVFIENRPNEGQNSIELCVESIGIKTGKLVNLRVEKIVEGKVRNLNQVESNPAIVITIDDYYINGNGQIG